MGARIGAISVTAVKGFGMRDVPSVTLTEAGATGDRDYFVVDEDDRLLSATRTPAFLDHWSVGRGPGGLTIGSGDTVLASGAAEGDEPVRAHFFGKHVVSGHRVEGAWDELVSDLARRPARLVRAAPGAGHDVHPVSVYGETSARALGHEADGSPLDPRRFRLLFGVTGTDAFAEDTWAGRTVTVGTSALVVVGPVKRCAAVQHDPRARTSGVDTLRLIKEQRGVMPGPGGPGLNFGVYAGVAVPGVVSVGDGLLVGGDAQRTE